VRCADTGVVIAKFMQMPSLLLPFVKALFHHFQRPANTMDMDVDGAGGDDAQTLELISGIELVKKVHDALPDLVIVILRPLPGIELARLACVNKVFWVALLLLRNQNTGRRYAAPGDDQDAQEDLNDLDCRLVRASYLGDVAVLRAVVAAGVDERMEYLLMRLWTSRVGRRCPRRCVTLPTTITSKWRAYCSKRAQMRIRRPSTGHCAGLMTKATLQWWRSSFIMAPMKTL